jgi:hypothetical protein
MATLDNVTAIASSVDSSVTTIAIAVGGFWAYFKFPKGRTLSFRADIDVSGCWYMIKGRNVLRIIITLKNLGATKIAYKPVNTNFQICRPADKAGPTHLGPIT